MTDINKLREVAEKAAPDGKLGSYTFEGTTRLRRFQNECGPEDVLALLDRLDKAEAAIERVRAYIESDPSISLEPMSPGAIVLAALAPVAEEGDKE